MDDNTNARIKAKAWRNSKKNSYEFFKYYVCNNSKVDWHEVLNHMTKKELLEYMYSSERSHNQVERWKEKFKHVSSRYSHGEEH